MSRKDYILIATELAKLLRRGEISHESMGKVVDCLSYAFKRDNYNFDSQRFEDAVMGGDTGTKKRRNKQ